MRVFLDNAPLAADSPSLAAALDVGRHAAEASGRVIVEAKLNGRSLTEHELGEPSSDPAEAGEMRLVSAEPRALVSGSMREVAAAIEDLRVSQGEAAHKLHIGETEAAFAQLADAVAVWDSLRRVMDDGPRLLGMDVRPLAAPGGVQAAGAAATVESAIGDLARSLASLQEAIRGQDWSTVADVLEGELADEADRWRTILGVLAEHIDASR